MTLKNARFGIAAGAALAALLALAPSPAFSLGAGTSGADFLAIGVGAQPSSMGGAYVAAADDVNATQWNPAGLALIPRYEAAFTHMAYLADLNYEVITIAGPIDRFSGWGASLNYFWQPPFDSTSNSFGQPTQAAATGYDMAASASYGLNLGSYSTMDFTISNLSLGASAKLIEENLSGTSGDAFYVDLGLMAELLPGLRLGLLLQNAGTTITFFGSSDPPPVNTKLGLDYRLKVNDANRLQFTFDVNHPIDSTDVDYVRWRENAGVEYWIFNKVALRGGYEINYDVNGYTAGAGFRWKSLQLDYAFVPYGVLGYTNNISLEYDFGGLQSRPDVAAPHAPKNLRGIAGDRLVSLSWDKVAGKDIVGYYVYYSRTSRHGYVRTNDKPEADRTSLDVRLLNDDTYFFAVTTVNAAGKESEYSQEISLKPHAPAKPAQPTGLKAEVEGRAVNLAWKPVTDKIVIGYNVYYSKVSGRDYAKLTKAAPLADPECRLKGLTSGAPYYFVVTAVTREGLESDNSNEAFARPAQDTLNEPAPEEPLKAPKKAAPPPDDQPF